jgi:hypothetical protein
MSLFEGNDARSLAVEAWGVPIQLTVGDPGLISAVQAVLPPGWTPADPEAASVRFSVGQAGAGAYDVAMDGQTIAGPVRIEVAIGVLDAQIRAFMAANAREWIFVHAGAIAYQERALLLPGASFVGKTALVAALVRAGATYFSDEFAVLDNDGLVHPYPKPLSIRLADSGRTQETTADQLGGSTGERPIHAGLIAVTSYRPGAAWKPERRPAAAGALALLSNTGPARERPRQALHAVSQAASRAITLEGERGEAHPTAAALLTALTALTA